MKKILFSTIALLVFIVSSCVSRGNVCNTYTDNVTPQVQKSVQDL